LELILATSLTAIAVVPALSLTRKGLSMSRDIETKNLLTTFCVSKLEQYLAMTAYQWSEEGAAGTFASEGYSDLRFQVTRSEQTADGGLPDQLIVVTATTWEESGNNTAPDSGESQVTFYSKLAKMVTYQDDSSP
jgi:hypothetical protein